MAPLLSDVPVEVLHVPGVTYVCRVSEEKQKELELSHGP